MKKSEYFEERGLERITALSDGVFAFSLTLLAVDLVVPEFQRSQEAFLYQSLMDEYSRFFYFFLTFVITGAYWSNHHRIFRFITRYDGILMRLNLYLLLFIVLMPFITKLINEHAHTQVAVIIAALGYAAPGLILGVIWHYASTRNRLINTNLPPDFVRLTRIKNFISPTVFLLSIPLSFIQPVYALYFWILLIPIGLVSNHLYPDLIEDD